jgi:hypothetical protein
MHDQDATVTSVVLCLQGSILQYARNIAEAQAGGEVPDAVIAVPAWYSQAARQAVIDAAALVNIKVCHHWPGNIPVLQCNCCKHNKHWSFGA